MRSDRARSNVRQPRRWRGIQIAAGVVVFFVLAGWLILRSSWLDERVRLALVSAANQQLAGQLAIGRIDGSVLGRLTLHDVRLTTPDGQPVLAAATIRLGYSPWLLLRRVWRIDSLDLVGANVLLIQNADGWNVTQLARPNRSSGAAPNIAITHLAIESGRIEIRPLDLPRRVLANVDARAGLSITGGSVDVGVQQLSGAEQTGGLQISELQTTLSIKQERFVISDTRLISNAGTVTGNLTWPTQTGEAPAFVVDARGIDADVLRAYIPALDSLPHTMSVTASASGTLNDLNAKWIVDSPDGRIEGDARGSINDTRIALNGHVKASHVEPAAWAPALRDLHTMDVAGSYSVAGSTHTPASWAATFDVASNRVRYATYEGTNLRAKGEYRGHVVRSQVTAAAYGAHVSGQVQFDTISMRADASGRFDRVNARTLPASFSAPLLDTSLAGRFRAMVAGHDWTASATFDPSTAAGASISGGSQVTVQSHAGQLHYQARAQLSDVDPAQLVALAPDRAELLKQWPGCLNVTVDLDATGTSQDTIEGSLTLDLDDSTLPGISIPQLHVTANVVEHHLSSVADGNVDVDVTRFVPTRVANAQDLSGPAVVHASVTLPLADQISLQDVIASATVQRTATGAGPTPLNLDASMANGQVNVTTLTVSVPAFGATASGTLAVAGAGTSNFTLEASASDLPALQSLLNQPVTGRASVSAHVTGTADQRQVTGTWSTTALESRQFGAVSANGDVTATMAGFDWASADVRTTVAASLIRAAGLQFNTLAGDVTYSAANGLHTHALLNDKERTVDFSGGVALGDEDSAISVEQLRVAARGVTWQLAAGAAATVHVSEDSLSVAGVVLTDGANGRIQIDGSLGPAGVSNGLTAQASGIAIANLAAWIPSAATITGTLDATATATGTPQQPDVTAKAAVGAGTINGVAFRRIDVSGTYRTNRVSVDATIDAADGSTLTATGTLPAGAASAEPWDLHIDSEGIDVALLQPAVPGVENLRGQGVFHLHVLGAPATVEGTVSVNAASFHVPATGVDYRNVTANFEAAGRNLVVRDFHAEDATGHTARLEGSLSVAGLGTPDQFDLRFTTDQLLILNNALGQVAVSSEMQILGDLKTPLVSGTIHLDRGRLEVDRWLQELRTAYVPVSADEPSAVSEPTTPFERSSLSITLDMPDNIVARGRDLRTNAEGPLGLGDINLIVGGALTIAKDIGKPIDIIGPMNVVRGEYRFQGRAFTIARDSQVQFRGDPSEPQFDITAERTISGVVATVHVTGTPQRPEFQLSSDPPLEQGDILSLIVFNQAMDRLPAEQRVSLAARAGALAAGAVATPISSSVARALDLDQFDIRPADTGRGASIVIGRQVNDRLFVGFSQELGQTESSRLTLEFRLNEYLRLVTSLAQGTSESEIRRKAETAGLDLFFVIR